MKKLLFAVVLALGMSVLCSCNKEGENTSRNSWIEGDWVLKKSDNSKISGYYSFSPNGVLTCYGGYINFKKADADDMGKLLIWKIEQNYYGNLEEIPLYDIPKSFNLCWYDNGTIYSKSGVFWEIDEKMEYKVIEDGLFIGGDCWGDITKVNNDKFIINNDIAIGDLDGTWFRVKHIKTQD